MSGASHEPAGAQPPSGRGMRFRESTGLSRWQAVLGVEGIVAAIAAVMPVTPSKTGSGEGLARWFFEEPGYVHEFLVYFIFTNLVLGLLGLVLLVWVGRARSLRGEDGSH